MTSSQGIALLVFFGGLGAVVWSQIRHNSPLSGDWQQPSDWNGSSPSDIGGHQGGSDQGGDGGHG